MTLNMPRFVSHLHVFVLITFDFGLFFGFVVLLVFFAAVILNIPTTSIRCIFFFNASLFFDPRHFGIVTFWFQLLGFDLFSRLKFSIIFCVCRLVVWCSISFWLLGWE